MEIREKPFVLLIKLSGIMLLAGQWGYLFRLLRLTHHHLEPARWGVKPVLPATMRSVPPFPRLHTGSISAKMWTWSNIVAKPAMVPAYGPSLKYNIVPDKKKGRISRAGASCS